MFQNLLFPWSLERLYVQLVRTMNSHGTSASPGGHACIILIFEVHTCIILKLLLEEHAIAALKTALKTSLTNLIFVKHTSKKLLLGLLSMFWQLQKREDSFSAGKILAWPNNHVMVIHDRDFSKWQGGAKVKWRKEEGQSGSDGWRVRGSDGKRPYFRPFCTLA